MVADHYKASKMFTNNSQKYQNYETNDESGLGIGEHNLFDEYEPSLQYQSIFRYFQMPPSSDLIEDSSKQKITSGEKLVSSFIILFMYFVVLITFPITGFFVIKKIKPLERCLVYRLGKRLPLKGRCFF